MENEATCNFEDIYYNMDGQTENDSKQHTKQLLDDTTSKMNIFSIYCTYIYNYLMSWFFSPHINTLYE